MISDLPIISDDPHIQAHYEKCRAEGTSHTLAEMFAFQTPPGGGFTDSVFLEGECNGNQFEGMEHIGDFYAKMARKAGVNTKGKVYKSGLAKFPGDPEAWVSDKHDVQKLLERRGWGAEGAVNVKMDQSAKPLEDVAVADDIFENRVEDILEQNPGIETQATMAELREQAFQELKPHWSE